MFLARSCQLGWLACCTSCSVPKPMISRASRPAPPNIRIGPQFGPWETLTGPVRRFLPPPPAALVAGRRPAGAVLDGRALVGVVFVAALVAVFVAVPDCAGTTLAADLAGAALAAFAETGAAFVAAG